jgi:hypothetical protein
MVFRKLEMAFTAMEMTSRKLEMTFATMEMAFHKLEMLFKENGIDARPAGNAEVTT